MKFNIQFMRKSFLVYRYKNFYIDISHSDSKFYILFLILPDFL